VAISEPSKNSEIAIFVRLVTAEMGDTSPELAQFILALGFDDEAEARMRELTAKSQRGSLSSEGQAEIRNFVNAVRSLALLHSKARESLEARQASWETEIPQSSSFSTYEAISSLSQHLGRPKPAIYCASSRHATRHSDYRG
jgi:hypothetical protein